VSDVNFPSHVRAHGVGAMSKPGRMSMTDTSPMRSCLPFAVLARDRGEVAQLRARLAADRASDDPDVRDASCILEAEVFRLERARVDLPAVVYLLAAAAGFLVVVLIWAALGKGKSRLYLHGGHAVSLHADLNPKPASGD